jgi:hypothetical protein
LRDRVIGHAQADRPAPRVEHPARQLARRLEDEREAPRRQRLEESIARVVDAGVGAELGQIPAHQREVVALVDGADAAQAGHRALVAEVRAERVAGVGGIGDHPAVEDDRRRARDQARRRMGGVDLEVLRQGGTSGRGRRSVTSRATPV